MMRSEETKQIQQMQKLQNAQKIQKKQNSQKDTEEQNSRKPEKREKLAKLKKLLVRLVFPPRCPYCREILPWTSEVGLCGNCRKTFPYIKGNRCFSCGKGIPEGETLCADCRKRKHSFDQGTALITYTPKASRMILRMKNEGEQVTARWLGQEMARRLGETILLWQPDCLVPVPLTARKKRIRGFNQAELLAREIGRELDIPVRTDLLFRQKASSEQKKLDYAERLNNMKEAFVVRQDKSIIPSRVLLVDDVATTGSTLDACTLALREAGAQHVFAVTAAAGEDRE